MRILIIGSGGREHALAWKLKQRPDVTELFVAPGNGGTAGIATNVPIKDSDIPALVAFAREKAVDLVVPGPELPLTLGVVDAMKEAFGDYLIVLPRLRDHLTRPADGVTQNPMYAPGQRYQTNLDYLTEVALLSKCDSLVGSMSSGMRTAIIWNAEHYEHVVVFEKGLW